MTTLTTIHVSITLKNVTRKRPLRIYDATSNTLGIVLKGACHPVVATSPTSVALTKGAPRPTELCRAAKLTDLGIAGRALPEGTFARQPKAAKLAGTGLSVQELIALLKANGIKLAAA